MRQVYSYMPIFVQNILLTVFNLYVKYKKYGIIKYRYELDCNMLSRLNRFKESSVKYSKYYKSRKEKYPDLSSLDDIQCWPILYKYNLKNNSSDFYSKNANPLNSIILKTSGSTGTPLKVKVSFKDLRLRFMLYKKMLCMHGIDKKVFAKLTGNYIACNKQIYRKDLLSKEVFLSTFHLSDEHAQSYFEALKLGRVEVLEGYPSAIYKLVLLLKKYNLRYDGITHVLSTAEKLHSYQSQIISDFFGCSVIDYYGSNDQSPFIFTCTKGRLHLAEESGYVELINDKGSKVRKGDVGRMLITSFTSTSMPLIRYDIGDLAIESVEQRCGCGSKGMIFDEIIGRDDDVFTTLDGTFFPRFSLLLKHLPSAVDESQIILSKSSYLITLKYTSSNFISDSEFSAFSKEVRKRLGVNYTIKFIYQNKLYRTKRGKFKSVVIND